MAFGGNGRCFNMPEGCGMKGMGRMTVVETELRTFFVCLAEFGLSFVGEGELLNNFE